MESVYPEGVIAQKTPQYRPSNIASDARFHDDSCIHTHQSSLSRRQAFFRSEGDMKSRKDWSKADFIQHKFGGEEIFKKLPYHSL
jgi:hypothetical protein